MTTAATIPMRWCAEEDRRSDFCCSCCGRLLLGSPLWVEVINGGCDVAAPGLGADTNDPGYMGFHPVGPTCGRRHFPGFTHDSTAIGYEPPAPPAEAGGAER